MISFEYEVTDKNGIHARPAGILVSEAKKFSCSITITLNDKSADAKRLFSVMGLGAAAGDILTVTADGSDEKEAAEGLRSSMNSAGL